MSCFIYPALIALPPEVRISTQRRDVVISALHISQYYTLLLKSVCAFGIVFINMDSKNLKIQYCNDVNSPEITDLMQF